MKTETDVLIEIQRQIFEQTGRRTDVHYSEGRGALFVPKGYPLERRYVIFAIDDMQLRFMRL